MASTMIINFQHKEAFNEYVIYSLKGYDRKFRGFRFLQFKDMECLILFDELDITGILVINLNMVEKHDIEDYEQKFLHNYFHKKGIKGVIIPDDFMKARNLEDVFEFCAAHSCLVSLEWIEDDELSISEFAKDEETNDLLCRDIGGDGEVDDEWYEVDFGTQDIALVTLFDIYANNLQEYVTGKPAQKLELVR